MKKSHFVDILVQDLRDNVRKYIDVKLDYSTNYYLRDALDFTTRAEYYTLFAINLKNELNDEF
jgi:hypothetical protein